MDIAASFLEPEEPSCRMTFSDVNTTLDSIGCSDDDNDENIASPNLAEHAVIKGIGKIEAIDTVYPDMVVARTGAAKTTYLFLQA